MGLEITPSRKRR